MIFFLIILSFFSSSLRAASVPSLCDILDIKDCEGVTKQLRRSSMVSLPSPTTTALLNPATVSFDRGLGLEIIHQNNNPDLFNVATGSGKFGGALISSSMENAFFGNRVYELDDQYLKRNINKKQYKGKKMSLALGGKVFHRKDIALDMGVLLKRHSELKKINPGIGASGRIWLLTFGASHYQDDFLLDYTNHLDPQTGLPYNIGGNNKYSETFQVTTYSVGTKIQNFGFDYGYIQTKYRRDLMNTSVRLWAASYQYRSFLFNMALRQEISPAPKYGNKQLIYEDKNNEVYGGVQVSLGRHLIMGVNYNYFLLREISLSATLFL